MKDTKEALGSGVRPDTTHVRKSIKVAIARAKEYGADKYERANYLQPPTENYDMKDHFERFRGQLRAASGHIDDVLDSMERHQATDPNLEDVEGMLTACYAADSKPTERFRPSGLPHVYHACSSLGVGIEQAVMYGLLPEDAGQPWKEGEGRTKEIVGGVVKPELEKESPEGFDPKDEVCLCAVGNYRVGYSDPAGWVVRDENLNLLGIHVDKKSADRYIRELTATEA